MSTNTYNPYENVVSVIRKAAGNLQMPEDDYRFLLYPERQLEVSLPVVMDDGHTEIFEGYRVQYSSILGPCKGGIRYHQNTDINEVKALACWMALKCSVAGIPYGGGKGGITVDPSRLSQRELEVLTKKYARAIAPVIGEHTDIPAPDVNTNGQIMAWFCDSYAVTVGKFTPAVVTGKPLEIGGSLGRTEATGLGVSLVARELAKRIGKPLDKASIAIQGNGNVGGVSAKMLARLGCKIVAVSDASGAVFCPSGLDIAKISGFSSDHRMLSELSDADVTFVPGVEGNEKLLESDVDILIPAAMENQITKENAALIRAPYILEAANGPTTVEADAILEKAGKIIVPDILTNSGGVIVSYFEWVQNLQSDYWTLETVNARLEMKLTAAFDRVWEMAKKQNYTLRTAAYMVAIDRIVKAKKLRGEY